MGNGDEKGSANKSCDPAKKVKHKRSDEALERRRNKRCAKNKVNRQTLREARKELKQVAPAQLTYTKAQDSPNAETQKDHTTFDWKNKQDKGAGISHFLWAEEQILHHDATNKCVEKYEEATLQQMFDNVCEEK